MAELIKSEGAAIRSSDLTALVRWPRVITLETVHTTVWNPILSPMSLGYSSSKYTGLYRDCYL